MSAENVELVRRIFAAACRRDTEAVLALYASDVEWDTSQGSIGQLMGGRPFRGHDGLRQLFRDLHEAYEDIEDRCEELIDGGEHVVSVVTTRGRGRLSGVEVEQRHQAAVWTIRSGKVARVVWYPSREEALAAAGLAL
jgi:ketosteroid isomerase-like protein